MAIQGFIFDLDGVLTDTAEYHYQAWKRLADESGLPFNRQDNEALRGVSRRESLLLILKGREISEADLQVMMDRKNQYYLDLVAQITPKNLLPGAKELLVQIRAAGMKTALGSASKNARQVIDLLGIAPLLDAISDGHSVARQKPAPDLFLHAAHQLGLPPGDCVVVEDAAAGIEAAITGGFQTLGIGPWERVGKADVVLPNLHAVYLSDLLTALSITRPLQLEE